MAKKNEPVYLKKWHRWRYKNTTLLFISLGIFIYFVRTPAVDSFIKQIGTFGYLGAFVTGIFFVSTFTAAPAAYVLFNLADHQHPLEIAIMAGLGAMVGDYLIFRLMKDKIFEELQPLLGNLQQSPYVRKLFKTPYFAWLLPFIGAAIIASPLPDEVGVSMLGLSKIRKWQFFIVTYALNAVGIYIIVSLARL